MLKIKNPYPGFHDGIHRAYEVDESSLFYGRDQDISNIKLRLRQNRLVALLGQSKTGKTSFLRAGVMADFDKNLFNGINGPRWKSVYFTPEQDPILSMARAIVNPKSFLSEKIKPSMEEEVLRKLEKNDYGLIRVAEDIIGDQTYNLLLVIDDFADVLGKKVSVKRRDQFISLITKAIKTTNLGFYCIIAMNLEDLSNRELKEYEDLYKSVMRGNYQIRLLDQMGLKDAIEIPAKIEKSEVEEQLSLQLIEELISDTDQLRKLQVYMSKTWFEWKKNHTNKFIDVNHFLKATGQRQKVGLGKGKKTKNSKIKIKGEEEQVASVTSSNASSSIAEVFDALSASNRELVERVVRVLLRQSDSGLIEDTGKEVTEIGEIVNISDNEVIKLVNEARGILEIERKQVVIQDIEAMASWPRSSELIEEEEEAVELYKTMADAAILHYIDGIDIDSVFTKEQYEKVKVWYDDFLPTEKWAMLYHKQYELAIDFIEKLESEFGPVKSVSSKKKQTSTSGGITPKKKISLTTTSGSNESDETVNKKIIRPVKGGSGKKIVFKGKGDESDGAGKKKIVIKKK